MNFENIDLKTYDLNTPYPEVTVTLDSLKQTDEKNYLNIISMIINAYAGNKSEYTAISQYIYQSFIVKKSYEKLHKILEYIAIKEMYHLEILSEILINLNVNPKYCKYIDYNPNICDNWCSNNIRYIKDIEKFLEYNISLETDAIKEYLRIIDATKNSNIKEVLNRIIQDEKTHIEIFKELLKDTKK